MRQRFLTIKGSNGGIVIVNLDQLRFVTKTTDGAGTQCLRLVFGEETLTVGGVDIREFYEKILQAERS